MIDQTTSNTLCTRKPHAALLFVFSIFARAGTFVKCFILTALTAISAIAQATTAVSADESVSAPAASSQSLSASPSSMLSPSALQWSRLKYHGSKLFVGVDTIVTAETITNAAARKALIVPPKGQGIAPQADDIVKIKVSNDVVGRISDYTVWLEPDTSLLQRTSVYSGNKNRYRVSRFMDGQIFSEKRRPGSDDEERLTWDQWSDVSQGVSELKTPSANMAISRSEALFYLIGVADLEKKGDKASLNVYDRKGIVKATVTVVGTKTVTVDYQRLEKGKEIPVSKEVNALDAILEVRPLRAGVNLEDFKFLGYKGNIQLAIDPKLNVILQLSGRIDYAGDVTIHLQELTSRLQ